MMILQLFSRSKWSNVLHIIIYQYHWLLLETNKTSWPIRFAAHLFTPKWAGLYIPLFNLLQHCFGVCSIFRHAQITAIAIFFCLNQLISPFFLMLSWYYFNFKMKNNEKHQSIDLICSLIFKKVGSGLLPNSSTQTIPQKKSSSSPPFERPNDTPATWSSSPPFRRRPPAAGLRPRPADPQAPPRRRWQCWRRCDCGPSSWRATGLPSG